VRILTHQRIKNNKHPILQQLYFSGLLLYLELRQATLDWVNTTNFRVVGDVVTLYENNEIIVGTHQVNSGDSVDTVMGVAYLRDGKVHDYVHQRKVS
jgi:hypothetical protein